MTRYAPDNKAGTVRRHPPLLAFLLCVAALSLPLAPIGTAANDDALLASDRKSLADGLFARGLYQLALAEYHTLANLTPPPAASDEILFRLGECQRHLNNPAAAETAYRRLAAEFPDSPRRHRAIFLRAMMIIELGNPNVAAELLEALLVSETLAPDLALAARYQAGQAYEAAAKFDLATAHYIALRTAAPNDPQADYAALHLARLQARSAEPAAIREAMSLYTSLAAKQEQPRLAAEALFHAAALAYTTEDFATSARLYQQLGERYPDDLRTAAAALPAAWAALRSGRSTDTISRADNALANATLTPAQRAEWLYLQANANRQLNQHDAAVALYDTLLATDPGSPYAHAARHEQLISLYRSGAYPRFLTESDAFTDPPADFKAELIWLQASAAEALKETPRAIQYYRQLTREAPDSPHAPYATYRLADQLQRQQAWAEASRHYLHLATTWPTNTLAPPALFASGLALAQAGQSEAALRDWHQLLTRFPDHETIPSALFQKAQEEVKLQRDKDAAATLDRLIAGHPAYELVDEARFWRAQLAYATRDFKLTEQLCRAALAGQPATNIRRETEFLLGLVLHATGREAEAAAAFQPLIGDSVSAKISLERLKWLTEYQYERQAWAEAAASAREMLKRAPSDDWRQVAATLLGRACLGAAQTNEAVSAYSQALAFEVHTASAPEAALRLGQLQLAQEQTEAAATHLRQAAELATSPELQHIRAHAYASLGELAEKQQQPDAAIRYYMSVALLYHDATIVPHTLDRSAALLAAAGRHDESRTTADELIALYPESPQARRWQALLKTTAEGAE